MFDIARKTPLARSFGRPAKRILVAAAAFTLIAGGSALAAESTPTPTQTNPAPAAQPLLPADTTGVTEVETPVSVTVGEPDPADDADDAATASDAADVPEPDDASKPDDAVEAEDDAQGVHGACVSAVAQDKSTVGREHGAAVSEAAHSCPKTADAVAGEAEDADESDASDAESADKSGVRKSERSASGKAKGAVKSARGRSHSRP